MTNLRELAESDLAITLEDEHGFGLPVKLISPDGVTYENSANDPEKKLYGQILYETTSFNPDTGMEMTINKPVVSLRRTSLERIPLEGEKWLIQVSKDPNLNGAFDSFMIDTDTPHRGGRSIGYIKFYLRKAAQS